VPTVPRRFQFVALLLLVLWLPATLHCRIEEAGLAAIFACEDTVPSGTAGNPTNSCADDSCRTVESGQFLFSKETLLTAAPLVAPCECPVWALRLSAPEPDPAPSFAEPVGPPPLQRSWQFVRRAARPARAPDALNT
jgi:hypothetical protein